MILAANQLRCRKRLRDVLNCVAGEHENPNVLLAVYIGKIVKTVTKFVR